MCDQRSRTGERLVRVGCANERISALCGILRGVSDLAVCRGVLWSSRSGQNRVGERVCSLGRDRAIVVLAWGGAASIVGCKSTK